MILEARMRMRMRWEVVLSLKGEGFLRFVGVLDQVRFMNETGE